MKCFQAKAIALQGIAQLLGQLQQLGGLIRTGKTGTDALLLGFRSGRVSRPWRDARTHAPPTTRHIEGDPVTFQLQRSVLEGQPGAGMETADCINICLIVVDPGRFA